MYTTVRVPGLLARDSDFDVIRFPRAAEYVRLLPQGINSYPDCQVRSDYLRDMIKRYPDLIAGAAVPKAIADLFAGHMPRWIPEPIGNVIFLMVRDAAFETDAEFLAATADLFPYVPGDSSHTDLFRLMSPMLFARGAAKRWGLLHRGTVLMEERPTMAGQRIEMTGKLVSPPHLFPELILRCHTRCLASVLSTSAARDVEVELNGFSHQQAWLSIRWSC